MSFYKTSIFCDRILTLGTRHPAVFIGTLIATSTLAIASPVLAEENVYESDLIEVSVALDAKMALVTQNNAWFGEDVANIGVETDSWAEFSAEPQLKVSLPNIFGGELYGAVSVVGSKTFGESADGIGAGLDDPGEVTLEKFYAGWKREFDNGNFIELVGGNFDYQIGTGFLIIDGGSDGGDRGAFYLGPRSAARSSGLIRTKVEDLLVEAFYLQKNPRRNSLDGSLAGVNLEYDVTESIKFGATYLRVMDVDGGQLGPIAEELSTYDFRANIGLTEAFTLSGEYAFQRGEGFFQGEGWYIQAANRFESLPLSPTLTYRYASVSGDDPATADFEGFEPLAYGFTDYGQWYQGEITGNWIFANSNQNTHLVKLAAPVSPAVTVTGAWLNISIDEPAALGIADDSFGNEFNIFADWEVNDNLFLSASAAIMLPGKAAKQFTGGDDSWAHFLLFASFSF